MNYISMGINLGHDRGVAIVKNGCLVGALAQERVDRVKHSPSSQIPFEAIDKLLDYLNISIFDISLVGISSIAVEIQKLEPIVYKQLIERYPGWNMKIIPVTHHLAHAEAVFNTSPFDESIILIADGGGEIINGQEESETIFLANKDGIRLLEQRLQSNYIHTLTRPQMHIYPFMNDYYKKEIISIGKKYEQITALIGFGAYGEGKTMGLAPYGENTLNINIDNLDELTFESIIKDIYSLYLLSDTSYFEFIEQSKANIARTIQDYTEYQLSAMVKYIVDKYNIKKICLGGGVFLNCPANHKIVLENDVDVHIFPATGDDGQATGAAFHAYRFFSKPISKNNHSIPYLGISYSNNEIKTLLESRSIKYKYYPYDELASILAHEISCNKVVGILHGRGEIGPRALCHRSIIANPTVDWMKDYINSNIKHREPFRPFAPVVIDEEQFEIFELRQESPYMLFAANVKDKYKPLLPSITHIDGSARVQAVSQNDNPFIYEILMEFKKITGIPVLLNTSFNDFYEPMVETPENALNTFMRTEIDILVLENYIIYKEQNIT